MCFGCFHVFEIDLVEYVVLSLESQGVASIFPIIMLQICSYPCSDSVFWLLWFLWVVGGELQKNSEQVFSFPTTPLSKSKIGQLCRVDCLAMHEWTAGHSSVHGWVSGTWPFD